MMIRANQRVRRLAAQLIDEELADHSRLLFEAEVACVVPCAPKHDPSARGIYLDVTNCFHPQRVL